MNKQEVFDKVLTALRAQGRVSTSRDGGACRYRGTGGTKCAIGHLIPDELYNVGLEGCGVGALLHSFGNSDARRLLRKVINQLFPKINTAGLQFLFDLQRCHDAYSGSLMLGDRWEEEMRSLAQRYGLAYTPKVPA